jgi:hypothetical protein
MSKLRLTDRSLAPTVSLDDLIHIVKTGDTSQNPAGSSFKATVSQVVGALSASTVTGLTFNNFTYDLTLSLDNGNTFTDNLGILASDIKVTGGTYNPSLGEITFVNNSGGTFIVSGITSDYLSISGGTVTGNTTFTQGLTANTLFVNGVQITGDTYVTGGTYSNGTLDFIYNTGGGFQINGLYTGETSYVNTINVGSGLSANTNNGNVTIINTNPDQIVTITGGTNIQIEGSYPNFGVNFTGSTLNDYLPLSGGTVTGNTTFTQGLTANTMSASTLFVNGVQITGDTNFATNDLTFTANRTHNLNGNYLYMATDLSFSNLSSFLYLDNNELQIGNYKPTEGMYIDFSGNTAFVRSYLSHNIVTFNTGVGVIGSNFTVNDENTNQVNFIVKSQNDSNLLVSDSINDRIGIGTNLPTEKLTVSGNTNISGTLNIGTIGVGSPIINLGLDSNGYVVTGTSGGSGIFTGGTVNGATNFINGLTANTLFVNGVQITGDTYVTGGTYSAGTILFTNNQNDQFSVSGLTEPFTGGSGNCITDLYITNLHGCSPITIWDSIQSLNSFTSGILSFSFGDNVSADGDYSHAEGVNSIATGIGSHAEGNNSESVGDYSHAEGEFTNSSGSWSHAEGYNTESIGNYSHAEGDSTDANGNYSHAEGQFSTSNGSHSHAEGVSSNSVGNYSHAEGWFTTSYGENSHSEGYQTKASGYTSHSEGRETTSIGEYSHAEGVGTTSYGENSHSEGYQTYAGGSSSHSEGWQTFSTGNISHAEGYGTKSLGEASHAEGKETISEGNNSHAEGVGTLSVGIGSHAEGGYFTLSPFFIYSGGTAYGTGSHAEGRQTFTYGGVSHAEGEFTVASGDSSHSEGVSTLTIGYGSHAEGSGTTASGLSSHAEGVLTIASGEGSHAEGFLTIASGNASHAEGGGFVTGEGFLTGGTATGSGSHAEGFLTIASGEGSHAEGIFTIASGVISHAEGYATSATSVSDHAEGDRTIADSSVNPQGNSNGAHAEGVLTKAYGTGSHSEGGSTIAYGIGSHAEGGFTYAFGNNSHAEGFFTTATTQYSHTEGLETKTINGSGLSLDGRFSHAEGWGTIAYESYQHVSGRWNTTGNTNQYFIIGNGTSNAARSNALRVSSNGNLNIAGTLTQGSADYAEYFESIDGLRYPYGTVVELEGKKIKICTNPNNAIGVISSRPAILGNAEDGTADEWVGKYEKDIWGNYVYEEYEYQLPKQIDLTGVTYETLVGTRKKISENYDESLVYIPRSERLEWNVVGLMGQIRVLKNQQIPGRWIKMEDLNDDIAIYLVR